MLAASAPVAADEVADSSIPSWIDAALRHDPLVPASGIRVNLAAKNRVDRQASKIRGEREVLNELTVAPSPLSDADIVYAVRRRMLNDATIVSQGTVVRPEEKGELRERVVSVSDDALGKAIREELAADIRVDASEIEARASDGEVALDGSVTNYAQKRIAEQDARGVVGVAWVTNPLFVKTDQREDWTIRDDVDFNLETESSLAPFDLESRVEDGVVTLTRDLDTWGGRYEPGRVAFDIEAVEASRTA